MIHGLMTPYSLPGTLHLLQLVAYSLPACTYIDVSGTNHVLGVRLATGVFAPYQRSSLFTAVVLIVLIEYGCSCKYSVFFAERTTRYRYEVRERIEYVPV